MPDFIAQINRLAPPVVALWRDMRFGLRRIDSSRQVAWWLQLIAKHSNAPPPKLLKINEEGAVYVAFYEKRGIPCALTTFVTYRGGKALAGDAIYLTRSIETLLSSFRGVHRPFYCCTQARTVASANATVDEWPSEIETLGIALLAQVCDRFDNVDKVLLPGQKDFDGLQSFETADIVAIDARVLAVLAPLKPLKHWLPRKQ